MRIAIGGFMHESATFSHVPTRLPDFTVRAGADLLATLEAGHDELAGAAAVLRADRQDLVPLLHAGATPGGVVEEQAFRTLLARFLDMLSGAGPVDGILLALHGSTTVANVPDAQGTWLAAVRQAVGPDVPLVVTLDLHATPTLRMLTAADAFVAYRTAPHRDVAETGARAARLLLHVLASGQRPALAFARLPLLLPGELGQTDHEPMSSLVAAARALETGADGVLAVSLLQGYPWADTEEPGASVLAVAEGDVRSRAPLCRTVRTLADHFWAIREGLYRSVPVLTVPDALALARTRALAGALTFLCDSGDNPTAGADADDARLVPTLLSAGLPHVSYGAVADAAAVEACRLAGIGQPVHLTVGGRPSGRPEVSAEVRGTVSALAEDTEGGHMARVTAGPLELLLSERRMGMRRPEIWSALGLDAAGPGWVHVAKSGYLFPALADLVARTEGAQAWLVATPGASSLDLTSFSYARVRRPVYPLDPTMHVPWSVLYRRPLGDLAGDVALEPCDPA